MDFLCDLLFLSGPPLLPLITFPGFVLQIFQRLLKRIVLNKEPQKQRVNEMEQEDQYINVFDFLNNFWPRTFFKPPFYLDPLPTTTTTRLLIFRLSVGLSPPLLLRPLYYLELKSTIFYQFFKALSATKKVAFSQWS